MNFSVKILDWYRSNQRELPWRQTKNPYHIWLSEVILQQTRVNQGLNYYLKFVQHYPSVKDLADAPEEKVLKDWQGLGYYSRARNLQIAAQTIVKEHNGEFPDNYEAIRALKGVGDYTAAAIASICYDLPYPVLDGNVFRVISRVFGIETPIDSTIGKKQIKEALDGVFEPAHPGEFNQAIMEFGALYCTPKRPDCENCIFNLECIARKKGLVDKLPVKSKKTKVRKRYFYYLVIEDGNGVYIEKRGGKDIWEGLFQFPLLETDKQLSLQELEKHPELKGYIIQDISGEYKHVLSHQQLLATFVRVTLDNTLPNSSKWIRVDKKELESFAVPRLIHRYLETYLDKNKLF